MSLKDYIEACERRQESTMDVLVMENLLVIVLLVWETVYVQRRLVVEVGILADVNLVETVTVVTVFLSSQFAFGRRMTTDSGLKFHLFCNHRANELEVHLSIDVMDYYLLVGDRVDEETHELLLGIIHFMRQYTWEKHLET
ncbi:hypothetical protein ACLOJK_009035 [Asimina triloba]